MEISSFGGLAELGMDDHPLFFHHCPTYNNNNYNNSFENLNPPISSNVPNLMHENYFHHSLVSDQQQPILDFKRPAAEMSGAPGSIRPSKQLKPNTWEPNTNYTAIITRPKEEAIWSSTYDPIMNPCQGAKRILSTSTRSGQTSQDHILAERKRREKISQRFIALSALVPGLKKMDKASVLGDAVKHLKQLQDKIKILEEQTKKKSMEKLVFVVKKYEIQGDEDDESFSSNVSETLPEIQARFCNKDVLIIINCEKRKGVLEKVVAEIEKLNLSVVNSCVMAFGDYALNMTLLAKKDEDFAMGMNELANNLRGALKIFM